MAPKPSEPSSPLGHHRRWWSLSVRSLMLVILIVGGALGWQVRRASLQRRAVAAIEAVEGEVHYLHQSTGGSSGFDYPSSAPPPGPAILRRWIGDEYFQEVATVEFRDERPVTAADLAAVAEFPSLVRLRMGNVRDVGDGFRSLARLRQVQRLAIIGPGLTDAMLAAVGQMTSLDRLVIREGANLTDAGLGALQPLTRLTYLWVDDAPHVTSRGVQLLIERNPGLQSVELTGTGIDDQVLRAIGRLPKLNILNLSQTRVGDGGMAALAGAKTLSFLTLDDTAVGDAGLAHLANLREMVKLELVRTRITGAGLRHLAPMSELYILHVEDTAVDDNGLRALQPLAQTLYGLHLNGTRVTDAGIAHLTSFSKLDWLSLERTQVTDAGIPALAAIPNMDTLGLENTATTAEGHARLKSARPQLLLFGEKYLPAPGP